MVFIRFSRVRLCYFLFFLFVAVTSTDAQRYNFKTFSVSEGLPHSQAHAIYQTHDGYLWIGSYGGLTKFDGSEFYTYTTEDGLRDNSIEFIFEDSNENLWVATYSTGIGKMEGDKFVYPFKHSVLDTADIYAIDELRNGELWIGTEQAGIFIYDGSTLKQLTREDGLISNFIWDFWEDEDNNVWIATNDGISILQDNGRTEDINFQNFAVEDGLSGESVYRIVPRSDGEIWFASSNGITVWNGQSFSAITEIGGIELDYIYDLVLASDGSMWIGTYSNGVIVHSDSSTRHITPENGLSSKYIYDIYEDCNKNIWIATDEAGINRYEGEAFIFFGTESGLISSPVYNLHKDRKNDIWVGTREGIYNFQDGNFDEIPFPEGYESPREVWEISELNNGELLFLMPDNDIYKYDGQSYSNYSEENNLELWWSYHLFTDEDSSLWIADEEGLYHKKENKLKHYTTDDGLPSNVIFQVYKHKGYLWLATYNGVSRFDGSEFVNYTTSDGISHRNVSYITSDRKGNLWLGTGGGVTLLELDANGDLIAVENFGKEIGMELEATQILWFEDSGKLWQGTNGGIHRLDVPQYWETGEMDLTHFKLSENGEGIETNQGAVLPIKDNRVLIGTMEGLLKIDPDNIKQNSEDVNLYISQIQRNSQEIEWTDYTDSLTHELGKLVHPELTFPYGEHTYTFDYEAPFFGNSSNLRYRYKLKGFQEEWSVPTDSRQAVFTNLDPGSYEFIVQVKTVNSKWGDEEARLTFAVAYPFWQTYWFYGLIIISLGSLIYGYIKFRVGVLEKQRLEELVDEQTEDLQKALAEKEVLIKEIHHRVKNNLAVISGLLELQRGYAEDEFVNRVLSESQRRVQSISMIHEKLYQNERLAEIDFRKYVRELIDIISYSFNYAEKEIDVNIEIEDFKLGVNQGIPCGLILNELVSNAFEHGFSDQYQGSIEVLAKEKTDNTVVLTVADNGKGLPEDFNSAQQKTLGLTLIETLCEQLGGEFSLHNTTKGAKFTLEFEKEEASPKIPQ